MYFEYFRAIFFGNLGRVLYMRAELVEEVGHTKEWRIDT